MEMENLPEIRASERTANLESVQRSSKHHAWPTHSSYRCKLTGSATILQGTPSGNSGVSEWTSPLSTPVQSVAMAPCTRSMAVQW